MECSSFFQEVLTDYTPKLGTVESKSLDKIPVLEILVFVKDLAVQWRYFIHLLIHYSLTTGIFYFQCAMIYVRQQKKGFSLSSIFRQLFALFKANTMLFQSNHICFYTI